MNLTDEQMDFLADELRLSMEDYTEQKHILRSEAQAAIDELLRVGVSAEVFENLNDYPLVWRAVVFYVSYLENFENRADQWLKAFDRMTQTLPLSAEYKGAE